MHARACMRTHARMHDAGDITLIPGKRFAYVEKSGDTDMHKARLGLLPELRSGVLLLSNLGGSAGGPLTALKFAVLAILAGGSDSEADTAAGKLHAEWCLSCRLLVA